MKKVILIIILGFFGCGTANAGDCDTSISSATTSQLVCADDDSLTVTSNEKIKFEKQIFKNKILENENKELQKQIEKGVSKNEVNKFALLFFITALIVMSYGLASFITTILKVSFKR
jgi:hypothetical protein